MCKPIRYETHFNTTCLAKRANLHINYMKKKKKTNRITRITAPEIFQTHINRNSNKSFRINHLKLNCNFVIPYWL